MFFRRYISGNEIGVEILNIAYVENELSIEHVEEMIQDNENFKYWVDEYWSEDDSIQPPNTEELFDDLNDYSNI